MKRRVVVSALAAALVVPAVFPAASAAIPASAVVIQPTKNGSSASLNFKNDQFDTKEALSVENAPGKPLSFGFSQTLKDQVTGQTSKQSYSWDINRLFYYQPASDPNGPFDPQTSTMGTAIDFKSLHLTPSCFSDDANSGEESASYGCEVVSTETQPDDGSGEVQPQFRLGVLAFRSDGPTTAWLVWLQFGKQELGLIHLDTDFESDRKNVGSDSFSFNTPYSVASESSRPLAVVDGTAGADPMDDAYEGRTVELGINFNADGPARRTGNLVWN